MAKKIVAPYLDQAMSVLNRTTGVGSSRVRALGFLRQRLREGTRSAPMGNDGPALHRASNPTPIEKR